MQMRPGSSIESLIDDLLIYIFVFLVPTEILCMRKTCKRMRELSKLRIVWTNACVYNILQNGYPFPSISLSEMEVSELQHHTCRAFLLARNWRSNSNIFRERTLTDPSSSVPISNVRFLPGGRWLVTLSSVIWSVIKFWDFDSVRRCCEWSPRGAIVNGFVVNTMPRSDAAIAISVAKHDTSIVEILSVEHSSGAACSFKTVFSIHSDFRPVMLRGDLLAISDDAARVVIWNWRARTCAILQYTTPKENNVGQDHCNQVVFGYKSILVSCARSMHVFLEPVLQDPDIVSPTIYTPVAQHSFGWVDAASTAVQYGRTPHCPVSTLVRGERNDDPWATNIHHLKLYSLSPNPGYTASDSDVSPYIVPPSLTTQVCSIYGPSRCTDVALGSYGTAIWIQPQDYADITDQTGWAVHAPQCLVAAVFPGPLRELCDPITTSRTLRVGTGNSDWTSFDYDEELGRIALGLSSGQVLVLEL